MSFDDPNKFAQYLKNIRKLIESTLEKEINYLKTKHLCLDEIKKINDPEIKKKWVSHFKKECENQIIEFNHVIKHIKSYEKHFDELNVKILTRCLNEFPDEEKLNAKNIYSRTLSKFEGFFEYVETHFEGLIILFELQIKEAEKFKNEKNPFEYINSFQKKIQKKDLPGLFISEEILIYKFVDVLKEPPNKIQVFVQDVIKLEKIEKWEEYVRNTALFFNAIPIHGLGDLLSLPIWGVDLAIRYTETHFPEYKNWKKDEKKKLEDLKELERKINEEHKNHTY